MVIRTCPKRREALYVGVYGGLESLLTWGERLCIYVECLGIIVWVILCFFLSLGEKYYRGLLDQGFRKPLRATTAPSWPGENVDNLFFKKSLWTSSLLTNRRHWYCTRHHSQGWASVLFVDVVQATSLLGGDARAAIVYDPTNITLQYIFLNPK